MCIILFSCLYWLVLPLLQFSHIKRLKLDIRCFHVFLHFSFCLLMQLGCHSLMIFVHFWDSRRVTGKPDLQSGDVGSKYPDVWHQWILCISWMVSAAVKKDQACYPFLHISVKDASIWIRWVKAGKHAGQRPWSKTINLTNFFNWIESFMNF